MSIVNLPSREQRRSHLTERKLFCRVIVNCWRESFRCGCVAVFSYFNASARQGDRHRQARHRPPPPLPTGEDLQRKNLFGGWAGAGLVAVGAGLRPLVHWHTRSSGARPSSGTTATEDTRATGSCFSRGAWTVWTRRGKSTSSLLQHEAAWPCCIVSVGAGGRLCKDNVLIIAD